MKEKGAEKGITRRDFLKKAVLSAGVFFLENSAFGGVAGENIGKNRNKEKTSKDKKVSIDDQIIEQEMSKEKVEITPEYQRKIEKILLSVPSNEDISTDFIQKVYRDLIIKLPSYSNIQFVINRSRIEDLQALIEEVQKEFQLDFKNRIEAVVVEDENGVDLWSQDFGELVKVNGKETFIISADLDEEIFRSDSVDRNLKRKKIFLEKLKNQGLEIKQAEFVFEGGNITFDKTEKGNRIFIGYSDIHYTQQNQRNSENKMNNREIAKKISQTFGGAEVVVLGNKPLFETVFHIDQAFIILENKKVIINQCDEPCLEGKMDVGEQLRYYKAQLEKLGYETIVIKNTAEQLKNAYSSTNAIPFVDRNTGAKKVLMPVFPDEIKYESRGKTEISSRDLQDKGELAYRAFVKAGYEPLLVRDYAHIDKGNIHCLSNVLSKNEDLEKDEKKAVPSEKFA